MRNKIYKYGGQQLDEADIAAVASVMRGDHLTCGAAVPDFEQKLCDYTGAKYCVAVANGTAALHLAVLALNLEPGAEGITSPITFLSSANCLCFAGLKPAFADIDPVTANIDPEEIRKKITKDTKVLIPVHFAGQSCAMEAIAEIASEYGLAVIEDAAHAIGSDYKNAKVGSCKFSDMTVFSFHPVKNITTGEGGAITTNNYELYKRLLALRSHGVYKDGSMADTWEYEMRHLGYNYRLTDMQAALGASQLAKLEKFKARRREIVDWYNDHLGLPHLLEAEDSNACFHLYVALPENRREFYFRAREKGLNLQVHYIPVHLQPYYANLGFRHGDFPKAENYYQHCISLPLHADLSEADLEEIASRIKEIV